MSSLLVTISLPIAGLDTYVPALEPGWFVLVEGGPEPDKEFFLDLVASAVQAAGAEVVLCTTGTREVAQERMAGASIRTIATWEDVESVQAGPGTTFVSSLSAAAMGVPAQDIGSQVRKWRDAVHSSGGLLVASIDDGMLEGSTVALLRHLADAIVQFRVGEDAESVQTYLRVPRWGPRRGVRHPIHYQFTGDRIALDTRRRHV